MNDNHRVSEADVKDWNESVRTGVERELATFRRQLPSLLATYPGWYVAISDGKVTDKDKDEFILADRVARQFPGKFVLIQRVVGDKYPDLCPEAP